MQPGLLPSRENPHGRETKNQKMLGFGGETRKNEVGAQGRRREPLQANPTGADKDLGAGRGKERGGGCRTVTGNVERRKHRSRGAEMSGGGWQVAGAGDTQVNGSSRWEMRC